MADPLDPLPSPAGHSAPPEFSRGRVLPGAAAGCALPVVGILLALLLGLGLVLWSGTRPVADDRDGAAGEPGAAQPTAASDR